MVARGAPPRSSALFPLLLLASAAHAASPLPPIDFSSLGTVGVLGSFAGLQLVDPFSRTPSYNPAAATVVARAPNGSLTNLGETNPGGRISALCQAPSGTVYVGGLFTSVGGVAAVNVAQYTPSSAVFSALGEGVNGEVLALSCNGTTVYAGGAFASPVGGTPATYGGNVAAWTTNSSTWSPLPFVGLNGLVRSISPSSDGRSIFFGGAFSTTFSNSTSALSTSVTTRIPSLGSSLTPLSLNTSEYVASPTSYISGFGRPQHVFCPRRGDGVGSSWLLVDNQAGYFISRLFRPLNAGGVRLGNTFYEGRGTANFSFVSIPDNRVLTLTYRTNETDTNSPLATCSDNCPLLHDPSIPYQDFLFPPNTIMTGFQLNIFGFYGAGGGLHLLQLLSDGAFAYAVDAQNDAHCDAGLGASTGSNVTASSAWVPTTVVSSIPGTTQAILAARVFGGASTENGPTLAWSPFVLQDGSYDIFFFTPGCRIQGTCLSRGSVSVVVQPAGGAAATTTVIDQSNILDESTVIYSGLLSASTGSTGGATVTVRLAEGGAPIVGRSYDLIAEKISLVALSTNGTEAATVQRGYGLFEYAIGGGVGAFGDAVAAVNLNATATLQNFTGFDALSFRLSSNATVSSVITVGSGSTTRVFVGGSFVYANGGISSRNVVSYSGGSTVVPAPNGGLAGNVTTLVELDGVLYAAGSFVATVDGSVTGLRGAARWQYGVVGSSWTAMGTVPSVGGSISALGIARSGNNNSVVALGRANNSGLAVFDTATSRWNASSAGLVVANLTAFAQSPSLNNPVAPSYFAGNVLTALTSLAPGGAIVSASSDGTPRLTSLDYRFETAPASSPGSGTVAARSARRSNRSLVREVVDLLTLRAPTMKKRSEHFERQMPAINFTLPSALASDASASVLAGAFWSNGSQELMLLGGQFTTTSGISNLAFYDPVAKIISSVVGITISGTVRAIAVFGNIAWIGGAISTSSGRQGLSTYDLGRRLSNDTGPMLRGYLGYNASVNMIVQRPGFESSVIVAGSFAAAGSLPCQSICAWDSNSFQWSPLGSGLQGTVGSVTFTGNNAQYLIATGSFMLNSTTFYLARWDFDALAWSSLGGSTALPGPATAVASSNGNDAKIFVAGISLANTPYLSCWNGTTWSDISNHTLQAGSGVEQLVFLPTLSDHAETPIIESNRMLLVSGALRINGTDYASALYDGASWYPYLRAATATGGAGVVSRLVYSKTNFNLSSRRRLSTGIIILISIAIALGVVFLLVLIGIIVAISRRKDEPNYPAVSSQRPQSEAVQQRRPTSLLATVGAATAVLLEKKEKSRHDQDLVTSPTSFLDGTSYDENPERDSAVRARYSFTAENSGELSVSAGEDLIVLEASDPNWWLVASANGERGLLPSSYLA